jgi:menaquinone-dependent protoporphyrinogen oxidase
VLSSAVYMGRWMPEAVDFVHRFSSQLTSVPVWLFSSGPIGKDDPIPHGSPAAVEELMSEISARGHQVFVGRLERERLGIKERLITLAIRAPEGDYRQWEVIRAWAAKSAMSLSARPLRFDQR